MAATTDPASAISRLLGTCSACSLPLPLRRAETGEQSREWLCAGCGMGYRGILLDDWPPEFRRNVHLAAYEAEPDGPPDLPPSPADDDTWDGGRQPEPITRAIPNHRAVRCDLETAASRRFDEQIAGRAELKVGPQGEPFAGGIRRHGARLYDKEVMNYLLRLLEHSSERVAGLLDVLAEGGSPDVQVAESVARDGLLGAAEDIDLLVYLGMTPSSGGYPSRHNLRVALLAMSIGVTLGWDERTLLDLGIGCLLHDVGMLCVDRSAYHHRRILTPGDLAEVVKHPVLAVQSLGRHLEEVPPAARFVAYQMHERHGGTGYPRGYAGRQIHDLAKTAAVADVFVALVSPRLHRPGMVPYHALLKILHDTKNGLYDACVVRALLKTVSLFPIGSYVAFNDGRVGKVIRATGDPYDRPIVEVWKRREPFTDRAVVDLSQQQDLRITSTLARLSY